MRENIPSKEGGPRREVREAIEKLKNSDICYAIALALNHKYNSGGHSVGRSERSFLFDKYMRLNEQSHEHLAGLNPFGDGDLFIQEAQKRVRSDYKGKKVEFDVKNLEDLSCILLRLWIKHNREKMSELGGGGFKGTEVDYSFNSEIERAELIYGLYIQEHGADEDALDEATKAFINPEADGFHKYKNELGWEVDDLVQKMDEEQRRSEGSY